MHNTIELYERGFKWCLPLNDVLTEPFLNKTEIHEPHLIKFIETFVNIGDIVVDIGACFGYHTLELARQVGNIGIVYAFEPQYEMYSLLRKNVLQNDFNNVIMHNVALGDQELEVCLYNAYDNKTNYGDTFVSWTYNKNNAIQDITTEQYIGKGNKSLLLNKSLAQCKRLDNYQLEHPITFIKIDVQGFELMVLKGAQETINRDRPIMVIEFEDTCMLFHGYNTKNLIDFIENTLQYTILFLDHIYPCDHVCIPKEKTWEFYNKYKGNIHSHDIDNPINHNFKYGIHRKLTLL